MRHHRHVHRNKTSRATPVWRPRVGLRPHSHTQHRQHTSSILLGLGTSCSSILVSTPVQALRCKIIQVFPPPPLDVGPSFAQTKINHYVHLPSPSEKGSTHINSLIGFTPPPGVKTPIVDTSGRGPACFTDNFPPCYQMATSVFPLLRSTVIWFGILEFMSTGFSYDMIPLSTRGPGRACIVPSHSGRASRRPHHHASPPKRRRA